MISHIMVAATDFGSNQIAGLCQGFSVMLLWSVCASWRRYIWVGLVKKCVELCVSTRQSDIYIKHSVKFKLKRGNKFRIFTFHSLWSHIINEDVNITWQGWWVEQQWIYILHSKLSRQGPPKFGSYEFESLSLGCVRACVHHKLKLFFLFQIIPFHT